MIIVLEYRHTDIRVPYLYSRENYTLGTREIYDQCKIRETDIGGERGIYTCKYIHIFTHTWKTCRLRKLLWVNRSKTTPFFAKGFLSRHTFLCYIAIGVSLDRVCLPEWIWRLHFSRLHQNDAYPIVLGCKRCDGKICNVKRERVKWERGKIKVHIYAHTYLFQVRSHSYIV